MIPQCPALLTMESVITESNYINDSTNDIISTSHSDSSLMQVLSGLFVLVLQLGLQLVEAGSIRSKNTSTVFMRGLACLTISVVISVALQAA